MRPILLQSHTRALTKIKFNCEGDLLFSAAKDNDPHVWRTHNGELLGTFSGHTGVVWTLDVASDTSRLVTGSGDNFCKVWDVETGVVLANHFQESAVRCVDFAAGNREFLLITDRTMGQLSMLKIYSTAQKEETPVRTIVVPNSVAKPTIARFSDCNRVIFVGHEDGMLSLYDSASGECLESCRIHDGAITDFQFTVDKMAFITASKDTTAKIFDANTLECIKVYATERPVNAAAISPIRDEVVLGGGQEAMEVTRTAARTGKFEVRFFDAIFEEEVGRVKGHFGPINTVAYHPQGTGFASGAEDGYVRLHRFDPDYYDFKFE